MDVEFLSDLAYDFREALDIVVDKREYGWLTIFSRFPDECCRYSSDLLAEYLMEHGISQERIQMVEGQSNEEGYTHCWLMIDNALYIDITADQFNRKSYFKKYEPIPRCYVSSRDTGYLYECFDNFKMQTSHNIGIDSYNGDVPEKLRIVYNATIKQIDYKEKGR